MEKVITSKNTSINKDKVPAIYGKLAKHGIYGTHVFDVGCGKYVQHIRSYAKNYGICTHWHGFDPYNRPKKINERVTELAFEEKYRAYGDLNPNVFVSSNVLNVIKGEGRQREYLVGIFRMMKGIDECYITVYEGNRSGVGRITKRDCWQENKKLKEYFEIVNMAYRDTHIADYAAGEVEHCIDIRYGMIRVYPSGI